MKLIGFTIAAVAFAQQGTRSNEPAVFFSGDVALKDGARLSDPVLIQRVCKGVPHDETWTDSKGRFSFKVTASWSDDATADAAQAPRNQDLSRPIGNSTYYSNPITALLKDCEVQAVLAGYWSDRVSIALKNILDDTRVGTLVLHAMSAGQALTISATTLAASPNATKAYQKGMADEHEQKLDAALKEFAKSVKIYPKFAIAWFELGMVRERLGDSAGASEAWQHALKSDAKYERPYEGLAALAERQQNWADLEKWSHAWIQLDGENFPAAYLYSAVANAMLHKPEESEIAARKGLMLDKERRVPRLSYVLGLLLIEKREYAESAKCLRAYLEQAPNAKDAAMVRENLAKLEKNP